VRGHWFDLPYQPDERNEVLRILKEAKADILVQCEDWNGWGPAHKTRPLPVPRHDTERVQPEPQVQQIKKPLLWPPELFVAIAVAGAWAVRFPYTVAALVPHPEHNITYAGVLIASTSLVYTCVIHAANQWHKRRGL
jgi:hypothetical protein